MYTPVGFELNKPTFTFKKLESRPANAGLILAPAEGLWPLARAGDEIY